MRFEDETRDKLLALRRQLATKERRQEEQRKRDQKKEQERKKRELALPIQAGDSVEITEPIPGAFDLGVGTRAQVEAKYPNGMIRISVEQADKPRRELLAQERFFRKVMPD